MSKTIPVYKKGRNAGYDASSRRYRDISGKIVKKAFFGDIGTEDTDYGFTAKYLSHTPISDAMDKYNELQAGAQRLEALISYDPHPQTAQPIPSDIRAAMNLADYYCKTEGDVFQHIEAPIDISVNELEINCPDDGVKAELEQLYSPDELNMWEVLWQSWMSCAMYGVAFPLEVYADDKPDSSERTGKNPAAIVQLPPRFVWVGYYISYGMSVGSEYTGSPYSLLPLNGTAEWSKDLLKTSIMPMTYNSFSPQWNEQILKGMGVPLDPRVLSPIRSKALAYQRYPIPPLARAYRAISTRAVFEEMVRATIEGYRNQLWVFLLGDKDHPPSPAEMAALKSNLDGMSGERTGYFAWRAPLEITQHTPKPLDQMLSNESFQAFTLQIFRMLGSSVRLTTGNPLLGQRSDTGLEIDMSIWLKRLEFMRKMVMDWEKGFRRRLAERRGGAWASANEKTTVQFSASLLEKADLIKNELAPFYSMGLIDPQTTLEKAKYNYEAVLERKKKGKKDTELWSPPASFAQQTVNPDGSNPKKTESQRSPGRPNDNVNPNRIKSAWDDNEDKPVYFAMVAEAYNQFLASLDYDAFIDGLKALNDKYLPAIGESAYRASGGAHDYPSERAMIASNFVNSYAEGFRADLRAAADTGEIPDKFRYRAMLYPKEGFKMAMLNGQNYAMSERGARSWKRVLGESKSGPCAMCVADSQIIHSAEEPFLVMHPNDVCAAQELSVQYFTSGIPSIEVPVPIVKSEFDQHIASSTKSVRRRRAK